jgi:hypothetical protein
MVRLKDIACGAAAVMGLAAGLGVLAPAHAEVISLECGPSVGNIWPYSEYLTIDMSAGTVVQWTSLHARHPTEPTPAVITDDEVSFQTGSEGEQHGGDFKLDRDSGKLVVYSYENQTKRWFSCQKTDARRQRLF